MLNTASGSVVAPCMSDDNQPALYPKQWKNGRITR